MALQTAKPGNIARRSAWLAARLVLPLFLFSSVYAWAEGQTLEKSARNLDPSIQSVITCGNWQYGKHSGAFRVISGWIYGHSELYVQWVADPVWDPQPGQRQRPMPRVMATAVFPELDGYDAVTDLENVRCVHGQGGWAVSAAADNSEGDGLGSKYRLFVYLHDKPGKFRFVTRPDNTHGRVRRRAH